MCKSLASMEDELFNDSSNADLRSPFNAETPGNSQGFFVGFR
jgi:hypothetical protein